MNKLTTTLFVSLFAVMAGVSPTAVQAASTDEAAIKTLEARFTSAFNAKDVDAIMNFYVPNEKSCRVRRGSATAIRRRQGLPQRLGRLLRVVQGPAKVELTDVSITADTTLGFGHSIQHVTGTDTKGKPIDLTVRVTDGYRKINGNWLIVHEHVSIPVDLDTLKPDPSSKP